MQKFPFKKLIDLTHTVDENIPLWPNSTPFSRKLRIDYCDGLRVFDYQHTEGIGTHMDAPAHFFEHGKTIDKIHLEELITNLIVIDIREEVKKNPDYALAIVDLEKYEKHHGKIIEKSIVVALTGWSEYWNFPQKYLNQDKNGDMHFPGFSEEACDYLLNQHVSGIGIDTISLDPGINKDFPVHRKILGHGLFQIENLTNLHEPPVSGAYIAALPMKISEGPEAPARVVAFC